LGGSGGVVNSLDCHPASLNFLGCFIYLFILLPVRTFFTMEGGDDAFANFAVPTIKAYFELQLVLSKTCFV